MQNGSSTPNEPSRVPMRHAVAEISDRLRTIRRNLNDLRAETLTEGDNTKGDTPESIGAGNLESRIFELYPVLSDIEYAVCRLCDRVGVENGTPQAVVTTARAAR